MLGRRDGMGGAAEGGMAGMRNGKSWDTAGSGTGTTGLAQAVVEVTEWRDSYAREVQREV